MGWGLLVRLRQTERALFDRLIFGESFQPRQPRQPGPKSSWRRSHDLVYQKPTDRVDDEGDAEGTMHDMDDCAYKCLRPVRSAVHPHANEPTCRVAGSAHHSSAGSQASHHHPDSCVDAARCCA